MTDDFTIDVWLTHLPSNSSIADCLCDRLPPCESLRAARIRFEPSRTQFILSRVALRAILARYTSIPAMFIEIDRDVNGKPFSPAVDIRFNISHSDKLFACVVSRVAEVGIDVERVRARSGLKVRTNRFAPAGYLHDYFKSSDAFEIESIYQRWTCKEAVCKATGDGLKGAYPLSALNFMKYPTVSVSSRLGGEWHVQGFIPCEGYVGAIAVRSRVQQISYNNTPWSVLEAYLGSG